MSRAWLRSSVALMVWRRKLLHRVTSLGHMAGGSWIFFSPTLTCSTAEESFDIHDLSEGATVRSTSLLSLCDMMDRAGVSWRGGSVSLFYCPLVARYVLGGLALRGSLPVAGLFQWCEMVPQGCISGRPCCRKICESIGENCWSAMANLKIYDGSKVDPI